MDNVIDLIGKSPVQHGPRDEMAYLMCLHPADAPLIVENLDQLACTQGYSKVVAKVPAGETRRFLAAGYQLEAALPCFSLEDDAACFMAKYFSSVRKEELQPLLVREVLVAAHQQQPVGILPPGEVRCFKLQETDSERVVAFMERGPSTRSADSASVSAEMRNGVIFFGAGSSDVLSALACVLVDPNTGSAEITDLTASKSSEETVLLHLLQQVERKLLAAGRKQLFATARAYSFGNNIIFARNGYHFAGTLTNNTYRHGHMESANVWFKHLQEDPQMAWSSVLKVEGRRDHMQRSPFQPTLEPD